MEIERKKQLLKYCESLMTDIKEYDSLSFFGFLESTSKHYARQKKSLTEYHQMMYCAMSQGSQIIGGNNAALNSYKKFIQRQLKFSKQGQAIKIGDPLFKQLSLDEIAYIFGWLRRLSSSNKQNKNSVKPRERQENRYNKNYISKSKDMDEKLDDSPFAKINKMFN